MSIDKGELEFRAIYRMLDNQSIKRLKIFEDHIKRKIIGKMDRECFCDPRDDEMMSEIYPKD